MADGTACPGEPLRGAHGGGGWFCGLASELLNPSAHRPGHGRGMGHKGVYMALRPAASFTRARSRAGAGEREGSRIPLALCSLALGAALGEAGA